MDTSVDYYAGRHLIVDFYECDFSYTPKEMEIILSEICRDIGATVLFSHSHTFNNGGSSGAVILAESHCTWHHWIEEGYLALDIFVCGDCDPELAVAPLRAKFRPKYMTKTLHPRGYGV